MGRGIVPTRSTMSTGTPGRTRATGVWSQSLRPRRLAVRAGGRWLRAGAAMRPASTKGGRPPFDLLRPTSSSLASTAEFSSIPVLDLGQLREPGSRGQFLEQLRDTCHNVGFLYVANHGVPSEACDGVLRVAEEFFALPLHEKMSIHNSRSPAFRGYIQHAAENTGGLPDLREQVEFGVDAPAESPSAAGVFPVYRRLKGPNEWPTGVPQFRESVQDLMDGMHVLSLTLVEALMEALGLPANALQDSIGDEPNMQMKIARYPPAQKLGASADGFYGVGAHSDSGYLSILLQDDVGGLQAQNGAGEWVDAPPVPGTLVVNLGEMLQLASGGYYKATVHRVLPPPTGGPARLSVPYFFNPRLDAEITPLALPRDLPWQRPPPETVGETETHGGRNRLLSSYGDNAFKSLARSHPSVLAKHHPDLRIGKDGLVEVVGH